jgi:hypothetical protein
LRRSSTSPLALTRSSWHFLAHQLTGSARAWWDSYCESHEDPIGISWDEFAAAFREFFILEEVFVHKAKEFRKLKQGSMRVPEYASVFTKMMRYALDETSTDKK